MVSLVGAIIIGFIAGGFGDIVGVDGIVGLGRDGVFGGVMGVGDGGIVRSSFGTMRMNLFPDLVTSEADMK